MNIVLKTLTTLAIGLVSISSMSAQWSFNGKVKSINIEGGPSYVVQYYDDGSLKAIAPENPTKGALGYVVFYEGATSDCHVYQWDDKKEWTNSFNTSVTTVRPGHYNTITQMPLMNITSSGTISRDAITTEIKADYGISNYKVEGKFKDDNIVQVKNWLNGNKLPLEYKIDYSFLPYYNRDMMFDNISFILTQYLGLDFGYDAFWFVPGLSYYNKLPAKIKIKNGKEYIFQYSPREGCLYIEIKEDLNNMMLKRHKVWINW